MNAKIMLLPRDGIGPEVVEIGQQVLVKIGQKFNHQFEFIDGLIGHASIVENGEAITNKTIEIAKNCDAILLGAVGDPSYDSNPKATVRPEQGLLKIRKELGLFANIRPIKIFDILVDSSPLKPEIIRGTDILFFRELTGGIYFGQPRERRENGEVAIDTSIYSKEEIRRIAVLAFEAAQKRRKKVTSVDKSNVLETSRLWKEVVNEVAKDFRDVQLEHQLVDSMAMKLISNPKQYDVVLTENLFGDILTDEASQIAGSMGLLASSSMGISTPIFEPIHGSAPDIAGQNLANPIATILSVAMLLEMALNLKDEAKMIENSVAKTLAENYRTKDLVLASDTDKFKILGTKEMGEKILENLG
jgi:3-isopropylmalate dehydrogenase